MAIRSVVASSGREKCIQIFYDIVTCLVVDNNKRERAQSLLSKSLQRSRIYIKEKKLE